jgi:rhodanese-related sulfurtransferase
MDQERTVVPEKLIKMLSEQNDILLLDVRRRADLDAAAMTITGAEWKDPDNVDSWSSSLPRDREIVIFCVRGGSVSNGVVEKLYALNIPARFIEGGFAAWSAAGGPVTPKDRPS